MLLGPRLLGGLFVLATCVLWIAASFLAQWLVQSSPAEEAHLPPLLLVYICTSLFSLWLPLVAAKRRLMNSGSGSSNGNGSGRGGANSSSRSPLHAPVTFRSSTTAICQVLPVAGLWFCAQLAFTFSLANTSVTSNTILSSSSSMFTLLASAACLGEAVTASKLLSVAAVMAGTALVALSDGAAAAGGGSESSLLLGDGLCLLSALLYAAYTVLLQQQLLADDPDAPALFFGVVGAVTAAAGLPVLLALQLLDSFDMAALQPRALGLAIVNGLLDYVAADYCWARAVLLLGSTPATLGMSVQIPLATAADILLRRHPHWLDSPASIAMTACGTAAILAGVAGINLSGRPAAGAGLAGSSPAAGSEGPLLYPLPLEEGGEEDAEAAPLLQQVA